MTQGFLIFHLNLLFVGHQSIAFNLKGVGGKNDNTVFYLNTRMKTGLFMNIKQNKLLYFTKMRIFHNLKFCVYNHEIHNRFFSKPYIFVNTHWHWHYNNSVFSLSLNSHCKYQMLRICTKFHWSSHSNHIKLPTTAVLPPKCYINSLDLSPFT